MKGIETICPVFVTWDLLDMKSALRLGCWLKIIWLIEQFKFGLILFIVCNLPLFSLNIIHLAADSKEPISERSSLIHNPFCLRRHIIRSVFKLCKKKKVLFILDLDGVLAFLFKINRHI